MENADTKSREKVLKRIQRMEGQLRGIRKMVEEERSCTEILTQLLAVSGAMKGTISQVIKSNLCECMERVKKNGAINPEAVEELVKTLSKAL